VGASYHSDQLKALGGLSTTPGIVFRAEVGSRPEAIEASRLKLAEIVLGLTKQGKLDPAWPADTAVQVIDGAAR
jgi:hypothetical protein